MKWNYHQKNFANFLLSLIFPKYCCHCYKLGDYLCQNCYEKIYFKQSSVIFPAKIPLYIQQITYACQADPIIMNLIKTMKYQSVIGICQFLATLLYLHCNFPYYDLMTSVAQSKFRDNTRGFNQAAEIAKHLAILLKKPYYPLLKKSKTAINQAKISKHLDRFKNIADSFQINPKHQDKIAGKSILIIDDIVTTGATLNECAKVLKKYFAKNVYGLAVASKA